MTNEQLEAGFIASPEYYTHSGGTDVAWVDAIYRDLLGRSADQQGEDFWTGQAAAHGRFTVAFGFAISEEREKKRVTGDYQHLLGRGPDAGGLAYWVSQFVHGGKTNEDLIAGFVGSNEYFNRV